MRESFFGIVFKFPGNRQNLNALYIVETRHALSLRTSTLLLIFLPMKFKEDTLKEM